MEEIELSPQTKSANQRKGLALGLGIVIPKRGPLPNNIRKWMLQIDGTPEDEVKRIEKVAAARLVNLLKEGYDSLVEKVSAGRKPVLDKRIANEIAKARGLADLAGRSRLNREAEALLKRALPVQSAQVDIATSFDLPMDEAWADFASRAAVDAPTAQRVSVAYRQHRFTVLKAVETQMVEQIQQKLLNFRETGIDLRGFSKWLQEQEGDFSDSYARLVARNAVNTSYSRGRAEQFEEFIEDDDIVGWEWSTVGDSAVRASHRILDGKVFPKRNQNKPPKGHNCRCTWFPVERGADVMTARQASQVIRQAIALDPQFAEFNIEDTTYGGL